jgi:hypothetical protein
MDIEMGVSRILEFREKPGTKYVIAVALMMEAASTSETSIYFYQTV